MNSNRRCTHYVWQPDQKTRADVEFALDLQRGTPQIRPNPKTVSIERPPRKVAGVAAFGGARGMSKLNAEAVRKIRAEAKHWRLDVLAKRYGVRVATISEIINFKSWSHVV